ncbi:MAG: hypothetical protein HY903_14590 [Deltaproteobacteria bacterium]|nr:hypothetical protein [Deltaproteobacteria bacterium]
MSDERPPAVYAPCAKGEDGIYSVRADGASVFSLTELPTEPDLAERYPPAVKRVRMKSGEVEMVEGYLSEDGDFYIPLEQARPIDDT